jgi:hypothetical protein
MRMPIVVTTTAIALSVGVTVGAAPAGADVVNLGKIVQEPPGSNAEARFPDLLKLGDGRIMAVWHKGTEHAGVVGQVQISYGTYRRGTLTWTPEQPALTHPELMDGKDMRDPKLGQMNDGSVLMQWFVPSDGVYYARWRPGAATFDDPHKLNLTGFAGTPAEHGGILALAGTDQVLIPVYTGGGGTYFARGTFHPCAAGTDDPLTVRDWFTIQANNTTEPVNGYDDMYQEPSFVQYGDTVLAVVRHEQWPHGGTGGKLGAPALVVTWKAADATPAFTKSSWDVPANSDHLLKTSDGRLLFTFGDKRFPNRPTSGSLISDPTHLPWKTAAEGQTVIPIYDSGFNDQGNPSSAEVRPGVFITAAYNAKQYAATETATTSPDGGSLYALETHATDYR